MSRKHCPTMGQFYDSCGALLRSHTVESGAFPAKRHIAIFEYERGEATFDGSRWTWQLDIVGGL